MYEDTKFMILCSLNSPDNLIHLIVDGFEIEYFKIVWPLYMFSGLKICICIIFQGRWESGPTLNQSVMKVLKCNQNAVLSHMCLLCRAYQGDFNLLFYSSMDTL